MLKVRCTVCNSILNQPGALLFSPPKFYNSVYKFHLCVDCYTALMKLIKQRKKKD